MNRFTDGYDVQSPLFALRVLFCSLVIIFLKSDHILAQSGSYTFSLEDDYYLTQQVYNTENGMPGNGVNALIQDDKGYIWAATFNGLVRFDGKRKHIYNADNIPEIESNRFTAVTKDHRGRIWAGLEYSNIVMIDGDSAKVYRIGSELTDLNTFITKIYFDDDNNVWIGTSRGLFVLKNDEIFGFDFLPKQSVQGFEIINDRIYVVFDYQIYRLYTDGTIDAHLVELDSSENKITVHSGSGYSFTSSQNTDRFRALQWYNDTMVLVHEAGIVKLHNDRYETLIRREDLGQTFINYVRKVNDVHYVAGSEGFYAIENLFGKEKVARLMYNQNTIYFSMDHEGSIWLATTAYGMIQLVRTPVYGGNTFDHFRELALTAVLVDSDDNLWTGTNCDGLYKTKDGEFQRFGTGEGFTNTCIWSVMEQSDGTIWAGTWGDGVFRKEADSNRFERFLPEEMSVYDAVLALFEDSYGNVWFGSYYHGIFRFNGTETIPVYDEQGRVISAARTFFEDETGTIYVATDSGAGYYREGVIIKPDYYNKLPLSNIRTIKRDHHGRLWLGSYGAGIQVLMPDGESKILNTANGLSDNTISQLEFDDQHNIWLAGNRGVFFIDHEEIDLFLSDEKDHVRVSRLGVKEGLPIRETTGGFMPSSVLTDAGELFIPTVQGLVLIQTNRMELNSEPPRIYIEEVEVNGVVYQSSEIEKLPHDSQRIYFRFTALSFKNPENVQFEFKLEGFDYEWQKISEIREAVYTSLAPGDYTFKVKASNNDGFWNEEGIELSFTVLPPYWQTLWFFLLVSTSIIALLVFAYRLRIQNIRKYNIKLQRVVEERTHELKISNQELKKLIEEKNKLHSILAHDLRNPFNTILSYIELLQAEFEQDGNDEYSELTEMILNSGRNSLNLLENLLQWAGSKDGGLNANIENVELKGLIKEVVEMAGTQASFKNVKINIEMKKPVFVKADKNMTKAIVRNLLSNAIKFSEGGNNIKISCSKINESAHITVTDHGVGIPEDQLETIFEGVHKNSQAGTQGEKGIGMGLALCKEFVIIQDGKIWVESSPGKGSTFTFTLPLSSAKISVNRNTKKSFEVEKEK